MGKELTSVGTTALTQVKFDDVVVTKQDIINYLCPQATEKEIFMALGIMASYKLNPFKREVHLIKYQGSPAEVIVGYETYLKRAQRLKDFTGKPVLKGWKAWIDKAQARAYCEIRRSDWDDKFEWYVELKEFDKKRATWSQIPDFMGKKVAIAQAFRLAFPDELGGMPYTKEEHEVYDIKADSEPAETREMPKALPESQASQPEQASSAQKAPETAPGGDKTSQPAQSQAGAEEASESAENGKNEALSVSEALEIRTAGEKFTVEGYLTSYSERKTKTNKPVFDCAIYDSVSDCSMIITTWKKPEHGSVDVIARGVSVYVMKSGEVRYSCDKLEDKV